MATRLIVIRHGHSEANRDSIFGGNIDVPLTETGLQQARRMADFVLSNYKIDAVYASTLQRAWKTAQMVAAPLGLPVNKDARLREIHGGKLEGMYFADIELQYPVFFHAWHNDLGRVQTPDGENMPQLQQRGCAAFQEIAERNPGKTVAIVSHRVLLKTVQCAWERRPLTEINQCAWLPNCSVSELLYEDGQLTPIAVGQDSFMGGLRTEPTGKL